MSTGEVKTFLVGEAPSRTSDPARPFSGTSGRKLAKLGLDLDRVERRNLFGEYPGPGVWDALGARQRADDLAPQLVGQLVLLAGLRVSYAFGLRHVELLARASARGFDYVVIPHPSGRNRWWNEERNRERVAEFFRTLT